jgi:hypothetical protein
MTDLYLYSTTIMEAAFSLIDWPMLPKFLKEGINWFPFKSTSSAQDFSDLLVVRARCTLLSTPSVGDLDAVIASYIDYLNQEMVCNV